MLTSSSEVCCSVVLLLYASVAHFLLLYFVSLAFPSSLAKHVLGIKKRMFFFLGQHRIEEEVTWPLFPFKCSYLCSMNMLIFCLILYEGELTNDQLEVGVVVQWVG